MSLLYDTPLLLCDRYVSGMPLDVESSGFSWAIQAKPLRDHLGCRVSSFARRGVNVKQTLRRHVTVDWARGCEDGESSNYLHCTAENRLTASRCTPAAKRDATMVAREMCTWYPWILM